MECAAAGDAGSRVAFYPTFQQFICKRFAWIRRLTKSGSRWELVEPAVEPVLSFASSTLHDAERPCASAAWPGSSERVCVCWDAAAPSLAIGHATWEPGLLIRALKGIDAQILKSGTDLEYLANFLEMEAARYVRTGDIQDALVAPLANVPAGSTFGRRSPAQEAFSSASFNCCRPTGYYSRSVRRIMRPKGQYLRHSIERF